MAGLQIRLLGGVEARLASGRVVTPPGRKAQALLAYLALKAGQPQAREALAGLLWAETAASRARHSLRQALVALRLDLPRTEAPLLVEEGATVTLNPDAIAVDVGAFERAVGEGTPAALERAAELYGGDLLAGLREQSGPFEEWLLEERERLRELALEALARLLAHQVDAGAAPGALQTAGRLLGLDPLAEPVHRTLMRLYADQGRRGAALRQYQVCIDVLKRELSVGPEEETKLLYQEILQTRAAPPRLVGAQGASGRGESAPARLTRTLPDRTLPLFGRDAELAQLRELCDRAWHGAGQLAAVLGDPGIGKSRLAAELITDAAERNVRVLFGRAQEAEQIIPFGLWADALRTGEVIEQLEREVPGPAWRTELGRLFPSLGAPEPRMPPTPEDHLRLFEALAQLLDHLRLLHPLLVVLDDLHWADDMSIRFLAYVSRRVPEWPVTVLVTARQEELIGHPLLKQTLEEMARRERLLRLDLLPLSRPATMSLMQAFTARGTDEAMLTELGEKVWAATEGNPFVVVETMRALSEGGVHQTSIGLPIPQRVRDIIIGRLDRLDEASRQMVAVAAVIGGELDFALLPQATGVPAAEAAAHIETLVARRLFHAVGERLAFAHDRIREVAYERLLPMRRRVLHGQVAEALEALGQQGIVPAPPERLAHHFTEAGLAARAIPYWQQAGVSATERSAHHQAIVAFTKAIELVQTLPESPEHLETELMLRMNLGAPLIGLRGWGIPEVEATFTRALELCRRIGDTPYLAAVWVGLSQFHYIRAEHRKARELAEEALRLAETSQVDAFLLEAHRMVGAIASAQGELGIAHEHLARGLSLYDPAHHRSHALLYGQDPGVVCAAVGSWNLWMRGFPDRALERAREAVAMAEQAAHPFSLGLARFFAGHLHFYRGEAAARQVWEEMLRDATQHGLHFWMVAAKRQLARIEGDTGEAVAAIATMDWCNVASNAIGAGIFWPHLLGLKAEVHGLAGDLDGGLAVVAEALERLEPTSERFAEAELHRIRGDLLLLRVQPDEREAEEAFRQAIAIARRQGARSWQLRAATRLSRLLDARGERADARRDLAAIYDQFTEGFDTRDLREARALLV